MNPLAFLREECDSVYKTLTDTLRHDYGPERSLEYFNECMNRLKFIREAIENELDMDNATIAAKCDR